MSDQYSQIKIFFKRITQYVFEAIFLAFIFFFSFEYIKTGIITNFFNFNILLTLSIIFGIIHLAFGIHGEKKHGIARKTIYILCFLFISAVFGIFVYNIIGDSFLIFLAVPYIAAIGLFFSLIEIFEI